MKRRPDWILKLIAVLKLVKALVLAAVGIGALSLSPAVQYRLMHLQAGSHLVRKVIARICALSPHSAKLMGLAFLAYAVMFAIEGGGLLAEAAWAEYLTTIITASFLPIEVYELIKHASWLEGLALVANIAIVVYLVHVLASRRHAKASERRRQGEARGEASAASGA